MAADADATVYVIQDADGDADLETALDNFADGVSKRASKYTRKQKQWILGFSLTQD